MNEALPSPAPFRKGTLGRQLVVRVTALVALVAVLVTAATALATWRVLVQQVDGRLNEVTGRVRDPYGNDPNPGRGPDASLLRPGQPINTVAAIFTVDGRAASGRLTENRSGGRRVGVDALAAEVVQQLREVPIDGEPHTVTLAASLGRYRVVGYQVTDDGSVLGTVVVGIPLAEVDEALIELLGLAAVLTLVAIALTVVASRALVVRSLRPLNRVAAAAQQVSQLELDRGEVALAVRVPPADANPDSEVGRVGQAFNHMLNNVEDALAARQASETKVRQFVADASHELRNPLAAIRGYAELTRRGRDELPAEAAYAMSRVESEADRMSHLVDDLLLLARLDTGPDLDLSPTDLGEVVVNSVNDARAAGPDHTWRLAVPKQPVVALADRHRLHQVMANLLANARTHTPPGTLVTTTVAVDGNDAVITVADNGPGIPPDIQLRVFERFARADASRVRAAGAAAAGKSTGLGLAIVSAVVEAHRGTVGVVSQPGRTEFTVRLPLAAAVETLSHSGPGPDMRPPEG
jgi:two-component system OmpR family sensor kinase